MADIIEFRGRKYQTKTKNVSSFEIIKLDDHRRKDSIKTFSLLFAIPLMYLGFWSSFFN